MSENDADYMYQHSMYQGLTSSEYLRNRIKHGLSAGIHESGKLVAWAMTHDDFAIGFLHVIDEYRKKGFGQELTSYLINQVRKRGKIPLVHIEDTNHKSMQLAMKLGFKEDRRIHWFEIQ